MRMLVATDPERWHLLLLADGARAPAAKAWGGRDGRSAVRFRVIVYTVQSNRAHWIVVADSCGDLRTGTRGLMACQGNALRSLWSFCRGALAGGDHLEIIDTLMRMRNAYERGRRLAPRRSS